MKNSIFTQIEDAKALNGTLNSLNRDKFETSLNLAALVGQIDDIIGKEEFATVGAKTKKEAIRPLFGFVYAWYARLVQVSGLKADDIKMYNLVCDEAEAEEGHVNRSIDGLLSWIKKGGSAENPIGLNEKDLEAEAEKESAKVQTSITFAFKGADGNIALNVDEEGKVTTTNTLEEIREALALTLSLVESQLS